MSSTTGAHRTSSEPLYHIVFRFRHYQTDPASSLLNVNGTLYGTTVKGGAFRVGTVYSITPDGTETVLHSFGSASDGKFPLAGLIDVSGTLYGTTEYGGTYGHGTVYSITTNGTENVLYTFSGGSDGGFPGASLASIGNTLYGTTMFGGDTSNCSGSHPGCGVVYSISTSGSEKVLHVFNKNADGLFPNAALIVVHGMLYGTTTFGGKGCSHEGCGTVYRVSTAGAEKMLYRFGGGSDGAARPRPCST